MNYTKNTRDTQLARPKFKDSARHRRIRCTRVAQAMRQRHRQRKNARHERLTGNLHRYSLSVCRNPGQKTTICRLFPPLSLVRTALARPYSREQFGPAMDEHVIIIVVARPVHALSFAVKYQIRFVWRRQPTAKIAQRKFPETIPDADETLAIPPERRLRHAISDFASTQFFERAERRQKTRIMFAPESQRINEQDRRCHNCHYGGDNRARLSPRSTLGACRRSFGSIRHLRQYTIFQASLALQIGIGRAAAAESQKNHSAVADKDA